MLKAFYKNILTFLFIKTKHLAPQGGFHPGRGPPGGSQRVPDGGVFHERGPGTADPCPGLGHPHHTVSHINK